jgi:hypothetical protein
LSKRKPATTAPDTPLHAARERAAAELNLPIDDYRVKRFAMLIAVNDQLQARMAQNKTIDAGAFLKIDSAMAEVRAASVPPPRVVVDVIDNPPPMHWCSVCGKIQEFMPPVPPPNVKPIAGANQANRDQPEKPIDQRTTVIDGVEYPNYSPPKEPEKKLATRHTMTTSARIRASKIRSASAVIRT